MHIAPAAQALADLDASLALQCCLGQRRDLDAALVAGTEALTVNDRREDQRSVDLRFFGRDLENVVVDGATRVALDDGANVGDASKIVEDQVAAVAGGAALVCQLGRGESAGTRDLDPVCYINTSISTRSINRIQRLLDQEH